MTELIGILLLTGLDQLVKYLVRAHIPPLEPVAFIPHVLGLTNLQNTGAAFSMLAGGGARWFFVVLTAIVVAAALWVLWSKKIAHPFGKWTLVVLIAGALGNGIDRAVFGSVTDMFETLFMRFPVFNVADIYLTVGGALFCVYYLFFHEKWKKRSAGNGDEHEADL